ncbi:hypothetical protein QZH41_009259 [Actinostola sp. cb2023]|nr:hypothetical protein QZH41_009259 [Actinostola sp. cb2023]
MPPRKNPLEDARKRLQEKLDSIKEQSDYITQVLSTTVSNATNPAVELLNLKDRKKFFQKYSLVSQDLEKCLDFLLVLSDSVDAQGEDSDEEGTVVGLFSVAS